jgi:16S rRNA (cytidine1402-2'-O)-methyltransferase
MTEIKSTNGKLIMAANSIGNSKDIPKRSLEALQSADLIIFEEDKQARASLKAASLQKNYLKYTEHLEQECLSELKKALKQGKTAVYMSDQGCANLADPGKELLATAYECNAEVKVIPGPSSVTAALSACPFNIKSFLFKGFLNREPAIRKKELEEIKNLKMPTIILDTPYRLQAIIEDCRLVLGANRKALLALDISGENENFIYDNFKNIKEKISEVKKINFVIVIKNEIV